MPNSQMEIFLSFAGSDIEVNVFNVEEKIATIAQTSTKSVIPVEKDPYKDDPSPAQTIEERYQEF